MGDPFMCVTPLCVTPLRYLSKCNQIYDNPRDRLKQFVAPRFQRLFSLKALFRAIGIYTSTSSFSLEGEGWDEGEYNCLILFS